MKEGKYLEGIDVRAELEAMCLLSQTETMSVSQ